MLKYWATKQTVTNISISTSSTQKIQLENRKIEINASGKLLIGPTFFLFQSVF